MAWEPPRRVGKDLRPTKFPDGPGSLITINHGCFMANWTKTEHDDNGTNCGLSWVFGKHLGQAAVGHA